MRHANFGRCITMDKSISNLILEKSESLWDLQKWLLCSCCSEGSVTSSDTSPVGEGAEWGQAGPGHRDPSVHVSWVAQRLHQVFSSAYSQQLQDWQQPHGSICHSLGRWSLAPCPAVRSDAETHPGLLTERDLPRAGDGQRQGLDLVTLWAVLCPHCLHSLLPPSL